MEKNQINTKKGVQKFGVPEAIRPLFKRGVKVFRPFRSPVSGILCLACAVVFPSAWAAGNPGNPQPSKELFTEDFDNPNVGNQPTLTPGGATMLDLYNSAVLGPNAYTAAGTTQDDPGNGTNGVASSGGPVVPFWLNAQWCNGIWMSSADNYPTANLPTPYPTDYPDTQSGPAQYCNGNPYTSGSGSWDYVRNLSNALGQIANPGTGPAQNSGNHAITAFTNVPKNHSTGSPQAELTVLQTRNPIQLPASTSGGRFVAMSVGMAAMGCVDDSNSNGYVVDDMEPQFQYYLVTDPTKPPVALTTKAVNPCNTTNAPFTYAASDKTSPNKLPFPIPSYGGFKTGIFADQITGDLPVQVAGNSVGLLVKNANSYGNGNDAAFDNLMLLDLTPQMDKSFDKPAIKRGETATLTFTITNTCVKPGITPGNCEVLNLDGWGFAETLPVGLVLANTPAITMTCGAQTQVMQSATNVLNVTSGLFQTDSSIEPNGLKSCTISVNVQLDPNVQIPPGGTTLVTDENNITPSYINLPGIASVIAIPDADMEGGSTTVLPVKVDTPVTVVTQCVNNGPDVAQAPSCVVTGVPSTATNITQNCTPTATPGIQNAHEVVSCTTTFTPTVAETVTLTTTANSNTADPTPGNDAALTTVPVVTSNVDMQAGAPTSQLVTKGVKSSITTTCTNNGPDAAVDATCVVTGAPSDSTTVCSPTSPAKTLAANTSMSCTTTFTPRTLEPITLTTTAGTSLAESDVSNNVAITSVTVSSRPVADATPVPTLGEWALMLLSGLLAGLAALTLRRTQRG